MFSIKSIFKCKYGFSVENAAIYTCDKLSVWLTQGSSSQNATGYLIKASALIAPHRQMTFAASTGSYKHNYTPVPAKFAIYFLLCTNNQTITYLTSGTG